MNRQSRNPYQQVVEQLDLDGSVVRASKRNDMLPSRPEDGVGGQVGKNFSQTLRRLLAHGHYEPERAQFIEIPKSSTATRTAALLTLADRTVYHALVEQLRPRVEKSLLPAGIAIWPRGVLVEKRWTEFEQSPLGKDCTHVVRCDIANFYESISHSRLGHVLSSMTGKADVIAALVEFLEAVMRSDKGIPQGLDASDVLATAYLSCIDQEMVRAGFRYARHGDDVRIGCPNYVTARRALFEMEKATRAVGLNLSSHKSFVVRVENYNRGSQVVSDAIASAETTAMSELLSGISQDRDRMAEALTKAGLEQVGWGLFYHGNVSLGEAIARLAEVIEPEEVEISAVILRDAMARAPGSAGALESELFHVLLKRSFIRLSAGKSPSGIAYCRRVLSEFPDKTELVCAYLSSLSAEHSGAVGTVLCEVLRDEHFKTGWEMAWCLRSILNLSEVSDEALKLARQIVEDESNPWLARMESAKVLARKGKLADIVARRIWSSAPVVYRSDLIAALSSFPSPQDWVTAFLATAKADSVFAVVLRDHLSDVPPDSTPLVQ